MDPPEASPLSKGRCCSLGAVASRPPWIQCDYIPARLPAHSLGAAAPLRVPVALALTGDVPHHHLTLSVQELTYSSN